MFESIKALETKTSMLLNLDLGSVAFNSDFNMTHLCSVKYMSVVNCFVLSRFEQNVNIKFLSLGEWKSLSRVLISMS